MARTNGRWTGPAGVLRCVRASLTLVFALELVGPALAVAQVRVATLDELRRALSPGDLISVVDTTGTRSMGGCSGSETLISTSVPRPRSVLRTASPGPHDPAQRHPVSRAASRLFAEWRAHRSNCRRGDCRRAVGLRHRGRPQRDRRVGPDLSGIRGSVHGDWRACGLGGRFWTLKAARQIRQALYGGDHGERDAPAVAEAGPGGIGVLLRSAEPVLKCTEADTSGRRSSWCSPASSRRSPARAD